MRKRTLYVPISYSDENIDHVPVGIIWRVDPGDIALIRSTAAAMAAVANSMTADLRAVEFEIPGEFEFVWKDLGLVGAIPVFEHKSMDYIRSKIGEPPDDFMMLETGRLFIYVHPNVEQMDYLASGFMYVEFDVEDTSVDTTSEAIEFAWFGC